MNTRIIYGIKADGTKVDGNDPNFRIQDFTQIMIKETLTREEYEKNFKEVDFGLHKDFWKTN